jgi:DNA-binding GntR family transcriptional regulator
MTEQSDEGPLVDEIADRIRARIMSGEFAIGEPLRQAALAAEFEVSRTPVREALRQLQNGGLIEVLPNRGAVVRVPAPWEVRQAYEVRAELEGMAARRAATRISRAQLAELRWHNEVLREALNHGSGTPATSASNDCFHTIIAAAADNVWLSRLVTQINESFPRNVSSQVLAGDERHRTENVRQHDAIIAALEAGDPAATRELMQAHILSSSEHVTAWYERRSQTVLRR